VHKGHEVLAIAKAVEQERQTLTSKQQQAIHSKTLLEEHCRAIEDHRKVLRDQAEQNCKDIKILYQEIRNAIDERETQALLEVENLVSQEEEL
jgi:hypothetical protein